MTTFASLHCGSLSDVGKLPADAMRALRLCGRLRVGNRCFQVRLKRGSEHPDAPAGADVTRRYAVTTASTRAGARDDALATAIARCLDARHAELQGAGPAASQCSAIENAAVRAIAEQSKPWWRIGLALRLRGPLALLLGRVHREGRRVTGIQLGRPTVRQRPQLSGVALRGMDLSGSTMTHMEVNRVDMSRAILMNTRLDFVEAKGLRLDRANLRQANIRAGQFSASCSIERADFYEAHLQNTAFVRCTGRHALFEQAMLMRVSFSRCRLHGASFDGARLAGVKFRECRLDRADFRGSVLTTVVFLKCNLSGVRFSKAIGSEVVFRGCTLADAVFQEANIKQARFENCTLEGVQFHMARVQGAKFRRCTLRNVSFFDAGLERVSFKHCTLERTNFTHASWSQGRLQWSTLTDVCLDGAVMETFDVGDGIWMFGVPLHAVRSFSIDYFARFSATSRATLARRRPLMDIVLPRCIHGMQRGELDPERHARVRISLMEKLALAIESAAATGEEGRSTVQPMDAERALLWRSCLLDTVMDDPMYGKGSTVLAGLADAYASQVLSLGNTILIDWPDTRATMIHCISHGIDQLQRNADGSFAQRHSMALMQVALRARLQRDGALDMAAQELEGTYLAQLPAHVSRQREDLAPDAFPLWDGVTALLIPPEYYENRLLGHRPPDGRAPYGWADYIPLRPSGLAGAATTAHVNPFAAVPAEDFAHYPPLRTAHFASTAGGGRIRARHLQTLRLGDDEAVVAAAFATAQKPQGTLRNPERLLVHIEGADQLQRLQMPDGDITEVHFDALRALADGALTDSDPKPLAALLFCFATLFARLASTHGFGTEGASPAPLRWYASALVRRACKLDPRLAQAAHKRQWTYRLCGIFPQTPLRDVVYTCAEQIFADMWQHLAGLRQSDPPASLWYDAIWPESWR